MRNAHFSLIMWSPQMFQNNSKLQKRNKRYTLEIDKNYVPEVIQNHTELHTVTRSQCMPATKLSTTFRATRAYSDHKE